MENLGLSAILLLRKILSPISPLVNFVWLRLALLLSQKTTFEEIKLYAFVDADTFFHVTNKSLTLLKEKDFIRYNRVRKYLKKIVYLRQGFDGFVPNLRAFIVDYFPAQDPVFFASLIVHEATHAYLRYRGFVPSRNSVERHEMIALNQQRQFISKAIHQSQLSEEEQKKLLDKWEKWFNELAASRWWESRNVLAKQLLRLGEQMQEMKELFIRKNDK